MVTRNSVSRGIARCRQMAQHRGVVVRAVVPVAAAALPVLLSGARRHCCRGTPAVSYK